MADNKSKYGIQDENAGERIKDMADKAGVIGSLCGLVIGFFVWSRSNRLVDLIIGIMIVAAGIFASYVLVSVLYSYGDMISLSIEQSKLLKRLEASKAEELPKQSEAVTEQSAEAPETGETAAADRTDPVEQDHIAELKTASEESIRQPEEGSFNNEPDGKMQPE